MKERPQRHSQRSLAQGKPAQGKPGHVKPAQGKPAEGKFARGKKADSAAEGRGTSARKSDHAGKPAKQEAATPRTAAVAIRPLSKPTGVRPAETVPVILETAATDGFELIDSGDGEKLEQYGPYRIVRPEAQALWPRALAKGEWDNADAVFSGDVDEDGLGRWRFPGEPLGETWPMKLLDVDFHGRFTSFRHVGVFPEQIAHWLWMREQIQASKRPLKVLNLFGYTGVASLIAAKAGAEVTHVDASKKAIGWARENQLLAGLQDRPIRWICDDAMKFIAREERRGNGYDIILTDPPKFGRGPNGEVWHLFEHLPLMLDICRSILSPQPTALVLTAYSIRASFYSIHELLRETMRGTGGQVESGELILREQSAGRALSTSLFSRWIAN